MAQNKRICITGNIVADRLVYPNCEIGEKSYGIQVTVRKPGELKLGGNGAITAVTLGYLGHRPYIFGAVGNDYEGKFALEFMASHGILCENVIVINGIPTANTVVIVHPDTGERILIHDPGAGNKITGKTFQRVVDTIQPDLIHIGSLFIMEWLLPENLGPLLAKLRACTEAVITVDASHDSRGIWDITPIADYIDYLFVNEIEAKGIFGNLDLVNIRNFMRDHTNIKSVVLKLGARGSAIITPHKIYRIGVPPMDKDVVDTTGAGDVFCGGYIHGILNGYSPDNCGRFATAIAAWSTLFPGGTGYKYDKTMIENLKSKIKIQLL